MAVRYQCDRCGQLFDDARDFRHVRIEPMKVFAPDKGALLFSCVGPLARDAEICPDCARLLEGFMEGVC